MASVNNVHLSLKAPPSIDKRTPPRSGKDLGIALSVSWRLAEIGIGRFRLLVTSRSSIRERQPEPSARRPGRGVCRHLDAGELRVCVVAAGRRVSGLAAGCKALAPLRSIRIDRREPALRLQHHAVLSQRWAIVGPEVQQHPRERLAPHCAQAGTAFSRAWPPRAWGCSWRRWGRSDRRANDAVPCT